MSSFDPKIFASLPSSLFDGPKKQPQSKPTQIKPQSKQKQKPTKSFDSLMEMAKRNSQESVVKLAKLQKGELNESIYSVPKQPELNKQVHVKSSFIQKSNDVKKNQAKQIKRDEPVKRHYQPVDSDSSDMEVGYSQIHSEERKR